MSRSFTASTFQPPTYTIPLSAFLETNDDKDAYPTNLVKTSQAADSVETISTILDASKERSMQSVTSDRLGSLVSSAMKNEIKPEQQLSQSTVMYPSLTEFTTTTQSPALYTPRIDSPPSLTSATVPSSAPFYEDPFKVSFISAMDLAKSGERSSLLGSEWLPTPSEWNMFVSRLRTLFDRLDNIVLFITETLAERDPYHVFVQGVMEENMASWKSNLTWFSSWLRQVETAPSSITRFHQLSSVFHASSLKSMSNIFTMTESLVDILHQLRVINAVHLVRAWKEESFWQSVLGKATYPMLQDELDAIQDYMLDLKHVLLDILACKTFGLVYQTLTQTKQAAQQVFHTSPTVVPYTSFVTTSASSSSSKTILGMFDLQDRGSLSYLLMLVYYHFLPYRQTFESLFSNMESLMQHMQSLCNLVANLKRETAVDLETMQ